MDDTVVRNIGYESRIRTQGALTSDSDSVSLNGCSCKGTSMMECLGAIRTKRWLEEEVAVLVASPVCFLNQFNQLLE